MKAARVAIGGWLLGLPLCLGQAKPKAATKAFVDKETGVSFRYPAAWRADEADTYGANPLLEEGKETDRAADVRLSAGWVSVDVDPSDKTQGTAESVSFTYAVLPESTPEACAVRFLGWHSEPSPADGSKKEPTLEKVNGVTYHVIEDDEAGLGHSWKFVVYTTFSKGRCLGFSLGSETSHTDAPGRGRRRSRDVSMDNDAVMQSVRM